MGTPESPIFQGDQTLRENSFKRVLGAVGKKVNDFEIGVDYWIFRGYRAIERTLLGAYSPIGRFINEVYEGIEEQEKNNPPVGMQRRWEGGVDWLMNTPWVRFVDNEFDSAAYERLEKAKKWGEDHNKPSLN